LKTFPEVAAVGDKVVVTLDGSELSAKILPVVARLAEASNAQIVLLTVHKPPRGITEIEEPTFVSAETSAQKVVDTLVTPPHGGRTILSREEAEEDLRAAALDDLKVASRFLEKQGIDVEREVVFSNNTAEAIVETARTKKATMIAMATHGRSGLSETIHGSVASEVLSSGTFPVLLIRPI